jgi:hypothetical protein
MKMTQQISPEVAQYMQTVRKSEIIAFALALIAGPLGTFYLRAADGLIMVLLGLLLGSLLGVAGWVIIWLIAMLWAPIGAHEWNRHEATRVAALRAMTGHI